jgi:predicted double-glycine peptidase
MRVLTLLVAAGMVAAPLLTIAPPPARAGDLESGFSGAMKMPVTSMKARPFKNVVMQQYDFSCGAAVVATVLTHHYGQSVAESDVFTSMYENGDQAVIKENGFSFLDMKNYFGRIGMKADGYGLTLDEVSELGVPVIALIDLEGYNHFVVVKGIKGKRVLLGDPAFGTMVMDRKKFDSIRQDIFLVVRSKAKVGRKHFNQVAEWGVKPEAPTAKAVLRNSSTMYVDMFGTTW